jgi:predicted glycoside hydrolase/deacetylase ChbG (UPF0249 family)
MTANRRLIVNADDFGQSAGVNRGVLRGHDEGIVTSASLMVRWPAALEAAEAARARPQLGVGLHVDLGEWRLTRGNWVEVYQVVSLNDADSVQQEIRRQLEAFRRLMGREPSHIDSHQHVHRREPVRSLFQTLASELDVPPRHFSHVRYCGEFYGQDELGAALTNVLSADHLIGILTALAPGVTELACHPAAVADLPTMYSRERLVELKVLCDSRVRQAIESLGIELCTFHDVTVRRREPELAGGTP